MVGETPQQLVATVMMDNCFADHRAEAAHTIGKPPRDLSTVKRQVGGSSSLSH